MKLKFNVANVILPGIQLGEVAFEYEGTVLEIKESLELLPVLMQQYVKVEGMQQSFQQPEKDESSQEIQQETIIQEELTPEILKDLGINMATLKKLAGGL